MTRRAIITGPDWSRREQDHIEKHYGKPEWPASRLAELYTSWGNPRTPGAVIKRAAYLGVQKPEAMGRRRLKHLYPTVQILANQDHSAMGIVREIARRHDEKVSDQWAINVLRREYPATYRRWKEREHIRRSHACTEMHRRQRESAA